MSRDIALSVVVAASWSTPAAARTVASLGRPDGAEVIVASDPARVAPGDLPGDARWVVGKAGDGVPRLRRIGADAARGEVIAFVEDACVVEPGWVDAMRGAFTDEACHAATGPVMQGEGASATDWAVYFAEYALFAGRARQSNATTHPNPPPQGGRGPDLAATRNLYPLPLWGRVGWGVSGVQPVRLAGINFACRRGALGRSETIREAELSVRLAGSIRCLEAAAVRHIRRYQFTEALADRWRFGRSYGRERWSDRPGPLRRLGFAAAPAILGVQLGRLAGCFARDPLLIGPAVVAAPATFALLTAWSLAEARGWADSHHTASRRCGTAAPPRASAAGPATTGPAGCKPSPVLASAGASLRDRRA